MEVFILVFAWLGAMHDSHLPLVPLHHWPILSIKPYLSRGLKLVSALVAIYQLDFVCHACMLVSINYTLALSTVHKPEKKQFSLLKNSVW